MWQTTYGLIGAPSGEEPRICAAFDGEGTSGSAARRRVREHRAAHAEAIDGLAGHGRPEARGDRQLRKRAPGAPIEVQQVEVLDGALVAPIAGKPGVLGSGRREGP